MNNAGVVSAFGGKNGVGAVFNIDGLLFFANRRCRAYCRAKYDRHSVCNTAVNAAAAVFLCQNRIAAHIKRVVGFTAEHIGKGKTCAELNALNGGNGKQCV